MMVMLTSLQIGRRQSAALPADTDDITLEILDDNAAADDDANAPGSNARKRCWATFKKPCFRRYLGLSNTITNQNHTDGTYKPRRKRRSSTAFE